MVQERGGPLCLHLGLLFPQPNGATRRKGFKVTRTRAELLGVVELIRDERGAALRAGFSLRLRFADCVAAAHGGLFLFKTFPYQASRLDPLDFPVTRGSPERGTAFKTVFPEARRPLQPSGRWRASTTTRPSQRPAIATAGQIKTWGDARWLPADGALPPMLLILKELLI